MLVNSDVPAYIYASAWICLAVILAYFVVVAMVLHRKPRRRANVTQYEPPQKMSPALAGFLFDDGRCERAFVALLISLAAKGFLSIHETGDQFTLKKLKSAEASLPAEESAILEFMFPDQIQECKFEASDARSISRTFKEFERVIAGIAEPELISRHSELWFSGTISSMFVVALVIGSVSLRVTIAQMPLIAYLGVLFLVCGTCFVAAMRVWPATFRKLISFVPGTRRRIQPLNLGDTVPVFLTLGALAGFGLLAYATTRHVAVLVSATLFLCAVFRHLFEAPTKAGHKKIEELDGFREFLLRAEAGRLDRENKPGHSPEIFEAYSGYAVALNVERAWGDNVTSSLLQILQMDRAYDVPFRLPHIPPWSLRSFDSKNGMIQLNINERK
jgi:hypothetical protein